MLRCSGALTLDYTFRAIAQPGDEGYPAPLPAFAHVRLRALATDLVATNHKQRV